MQDLANAFSWLFANIHVPGWIALVILAWKASARFEKFTSGVSTAEKSAKASEEIINKVANNHLPHIEQAVNDLSGHVQELKTELVSELKGVRSDLLQYALRKD
jgi:hypothetical protein